MTVLDLCFATLLRFVGCCCCCLLCYFRFCGCLLVLGFACFDDVGGTYCLFCVCALWCIVLCCLWFYCVEFDFRLVVCDYLSALLFRLYLWIVCVDFVFVCSLGLVFVRLLGLGCVDVSLFVCLWCGICFVCVCVVVCGLD